MGRAKLKMELIEKEKSRILTFKKRREGLTKKLHQLTTLCDVPACMIIYDPATTSSTIWPQDSGQVRRLVDGYKAKNKAVDGVRSCGLPDFFNERQKQLEGEVVKLRKKNLEAKYPTWDEFLFFMDESQMRGLAAALRGKAAAVRSRIEFLKSGAMNVNNMMLLNYSNLGEFYGLDRDIRAAATVMDVMRSNSTAAAQLPVSVPNYYYAPSPPLPLPAVAQGYMVRPSVGCSSMDQNLMNYYYCSPLDQNLNWCGDDGDDITRYILQ